MADTLYLTKVTKLVLAWAQAVNDRVYKGRGPNFATTTGAANAQVLTLAAGSLYAIATEQDGDEFYFKAGFTNTGAMTLQVLPPSGTNTAVAVQLNGQALVGGEAVASQPYKVTRIGSTWQLTVLQGLVDGQPLIVNSADITKKLRFSLTGFTTALTRIVTWADQNLTFAALTARGDMWAASAAGVLSRLALGTSGQILTSSATDPIWTTGNITSHPMELRLSLTTGVPITTADVTAATTVRLVPYKGGNIDLYDGAATWTTYNTAEVSFTVPATTSTPFDIWARNVAGTVTLDSTNWTNDTTRATALVYQNGIYVKSGDTTRRYLGTGRTTAVNGQTEDSKANRYLWNYYNRVLRNGLNTFSADRSTTSATYVELNTEIRCNFVIGVAEDAVFASSDGGCTQNVRSYQGTGLGFDSTTVVEAGFSTSSIVGATPTDPLNIAISGIKYGLAVGGHFLTMLGRISGGNTGTWWGTDSISTPKVYIHIGIWG